MFDMVPKDFPLTTNDQCPGFSNEFQRSNVHRASVGVLGTKQVVQEVFPVRLSLGPVYGQMLSELPQLLCPGHNSREQYAVKIPSQNRRTYSCLSKCQNVSNRASRFTNDELPMKGFVHDFGHVAKLSPAFQHSKLLPKSEVSHNIKSQIITPFRHVSNPATPVGRRRGAMRDDISESADVMQDICLH